MKKYNLSKIMKRAWELVKGFGFGISEAIKKAWKEAKNMAKKLSEKEQQLLDQIRKSGLSEEEMNSLPMMYHKKNGIVGVGMPGQFEKVRKTAEYNNKRLGITNYFVCTLGEYLSK